MRMGMLADWRLRDVQVTCVKAFGYKREDRDLPTVLRPVKEKAGHHGGRDEIERNTIFHLGEIQTAG